MMTVPCHWALAAPSFRWLTDTKRPFPDVFARSENGFMPLEFCFVATAATKHGPVAWEDAGNPELVQGLAKYKN
jgi:hypothetical protein